MEGDAGRQRTRQRSNRLLEAAELFGNGFVPVFAGRPSTLRISAKGPWPAARQNVSRMLEFRPVYSVRIFKRN
jgi:hypothetical protein